MIKRELKVNFKSFLIWMLVLIIMFGFVYIIYPFIISDETMKSIDDFVKVLPPEVTKAFNMDMSSIATAYGWLKSEGFMFLLLITGFYSAYLGSTILLKEEKDKTIEYLYSLPVKRSKIVLNKIIVALLYIIAMVLIIGIFNYIALLLLGKFDQKQFLLLSITPLFSAIPLFSINLFISTLFKRNKKTIGFSIGLVFIFYILNVLSEISEKSEGLKYLSIYTLSDIRNVITNVKINPVLILVSLLISIVFITASFIKYQRKELV